MKAKQLLALLGVAFVVVAASVLVYRQKSGAWSGGGESAGIGALVLPGLPVKTVLEPKEWVSMPFVRTPQHPVMNGLTAWDLHF